MDRFKITEAGLTKAKQFVKNGNGSPPKWATKYKEHLSIKGGKLFYKERQVIPKERVDDVLRKELYKKNGDIPSGRDAAFHLLKQRYTNISRRALMEFIRKQKPLGEVKAAVNQPKQAGGERLHEYIFETDLIFLKKNDLEKSNKKFIRDDIKELTYFVSTVEKVTGLCRFNYVLKKASELVTPIVIKQCEEMAALLGTTTSQCSIRMDRGGEFSIKELEKHFKKASHVNSGCAVENRNASFQKCYFQILRQRKATTILDAMRQSEKLMNNTYNRIHKKTPNELVERAEKKENILEYNRARKTYVAGDKRKDFNVGDHVRLLVKSKKPGIDYKRYKNKTYGEMVYLVKKKTKKAVPTKYWVGGKWYLQSSLVKSAPRDEESLQLVEERDEEFKKERGKKHTEKMKERVDEIQKEEKKKTRPSRHAAQQAKYKMVQQVQEQKEFDSDLDEKEEPKKVEKSTKHLALIRYLKKKGLPSGGSQDVLMARVKQYKKSKKIKK